MLRRLWPVRVTQKCSHDWNSLTLFFFSPELRAGNVLHFPQAADNKDSSTLLCSSQVDSSPPEASLHGSLLLRRYVVSVGSLGRPVGEREGGGFPWYQKKHHQQCVPFSTVVEDEFPDCSQVSSGPVLRERPAPPSSPTLNG